MKTTIKIIGSVWIICSLVMILSAGGEKRYNVSQLRGKWQMENRSSRPIQVVDEYIYGTYTTTCLQNSDTIGQLKHWFYLSDSIVTVFDWKQITVRTSGKYIITQYGEDYLPPYEYPCKVYKILFLNQDSLVMIRIPERGEVRIGLGPVTFNRISN